MQIKVKSGVIARKSPREANASDAGFAPLVAGVYAIGGEINGRLQVLRADKPAVYLPPAKLAELEAAGEIEVSRQA